jgi:hypothetical protein
LRNWYRRAYPELVKEPNFNLEHNWLENEIFMTKYRKLFIDNIKSICKKYKTILTNVVFCIDCSHKDMWRLEDNKEYKGTRLESHLKNEFNSYNLFSHIKKHYLPQLQLLYGTKILYNNKCEADDIIGYFAPFLINNGFPKIFILANDNDYLQICSDKIFMINGNMKKITSAYHEITTNESNQSNQTNQSGNNLNNLEDSFYYGEKYLIKKILIGDNSDNIKCCSVDNGFLETGVPTNHYKNIYKNLASIIINDSRKYLILKEKLDKIRNAIITSPDNDEIKFIKNFFENTVLMDFQMIPSKLKNELKHKLNNLIQ